jgi:peptide/nickel transport system ATP-binding protein
LGRFPHQLSGGQRQRIIVARAMLLKPKVIIADEPVSMVDASLRATILEAIYKLHRELGVSVLYITHDLTTAYHIGAQIVVLYRGAVMEAGEVESLVQNPQHPYTRLLIDSVPWPDPARRWGQISLAESNGGRADTAQGCKFASRCPFFMPECGAAEPPLFQVSGTLDVTSGASVAGGANGHAPLDRVVACYLQKDAPALERRALPELLASV